MSKRGRVGIAMFYLLAGLCLLVGLVYSLTPSILPHHVRFLGRSHAQLDARVATMALSSLRVIGACALSIGLTVVILTSRLAAKNENWIRWTLLIALLTVLLPVLKVALTLGWSSPWWAVVVMVGLALGAFSLVRNQQQDA